MHFFFDLVGYNQSFCFFSLCCFLKNRECCITTGKDVFKQQLITTNPQCFKPFEKYALKIGSSGSFSQVVKGKNIKHLKPPPGTDNFIFPQAQTSSNSRPLLSFFPLFLGLAGAVVEIKPNLEHGEK